MADVWEANAEVTIKINGESVGTADASETLGKVAQSAAADNGLKTFSVMVNGTKVDTSAGSKTLAELGAQTIELVAKDARG